MKTQTFNKTDIKRDWYLVDANDIALGRLASNVATMLRGKHKPTYTPYLDMGDHIVVINAEKVKLSGNKLAAKRYWSHSGYVGNMNYTSAQELMTKHPERIIEKAVKGMLPKNRLGRAMYKKMKVYAGDQHPHAAQNPKPINF